MENLKIVQSAMRMAIKQGVNPYDTAPQQGAAYEMLWRLRVGTVEYTTRDINNVNDWFTLE